MKRQASPSEQTAAAESEAELMRSALSGALTRRELMRRGRGAGLGMAAIAALVLARRDADAKGSIPPNCIRVCCDGTCDSWKMCWKCVQWPKPTTNATLIDAS
jgi:hypothetical protein